MFEKNIIDLTKEELLDPEFIPSIYNEYEGEEREEVLKQVLVVARDRKVLQKVKAIMEKQNNIQKLENEDGTALLYMGIQNKDGVKVTIDNYIQAILHTPTLKNKILYNEFSGKFERVGENGKIRNWTDVDDAWLLNEIEKEYGIHEPRKCVSALNCCIEQIKYHPIKMLIEEKPWDGIPRIDKFLAKYMKCDDDDYATQVSRMIFYGGISRLYNPGVKFDYMPILIGEQGTCKSTIVNWLNIHPKFFREIVTIEGKDGYDILRYGWICEFPELLAMVKHQTNEAMKAYVTRQVDSFRPAYGRNYVDIPRHCIFIGTTNTYEFLTDNDNRRYLPIVVNAMKGELFKKEKECKEYILNCWREAKYLLDHNKVYLTIPNEYEDMVEQHRQMATEDDPELGLVEDYLNSKKIGDKVCSMDIFTNPMGKLRKNYNKMNARYITSMMSKFKNWKRSETSTNFDEFGRQRYWTKIS